MKLNVLICCEESQAETKAFRALGHRAFSCDVQKCARDGNPAWHIREDCTPFLHGRTKFTTMDGKRHCVSRWHLIIAHPPCTYLCRLSGVQLTKNPDHYVLFDDEVYHVNIDRYMKLGEARKFFFECLQACADFVAVENPVPLRLANLPKPAHFACPSWFGARYTKKTCYWTENLPPLMAECDFPNPTSYVKSSRGKYRSRTFPELASAIARQWSAYIIEQLTRQTKL